MSGTSPRDESGWTIETYSAHNEALREALETFLEERDRRYAEVKDAEEKALRVKEVADDRALELARQIQAYKDEKANELREQINSERGIYATKTDLIAAVEKLEVTLASVVGTRREGFGISANVLATLGALAVAFLGVLIVLANYLSSH